MEVAITLPAVAPNLVIMVSTQDVAPVFIIPVIHDLKL